LNSKKGAGGGWKGVGLLGISMFRHFGTDKPAEKLQKRIEDLTESVEQVLVESVVTGKLYNVSSQDTYLVPPHSILTEILFLDRTRFSNEQDDQKTPACMRLTMRTE